MKFYFDEDVYYTDNGCDCCEADEWLTYKFTHAEPPIEGEVFDNFTPSSTYDVLFTVALQLKLIPDGYGEVQESTIITELLDSGVEIYAWDGTYYYRLFGDEWFGKHKYRVSGY